jgi:two-component system phosphate regulon response regulator OmpR
MGTSPLPSDAHVLVVDDEAEVRDMVREYLSRHGLVVSAADGGGAMRAVLAERRVDLVVLDVRMPGEDGLTLARELRARGGVGILMLTAEGAPVDRILGLELGADDYVVKPFDPRELLARVRSVLRRTRSDDPAAPATGGEVRFGRCVLNLDSRRLYALDGAELPLTAMEFDLLRAFAANPNRVLSRDRLLELAHNRGMEPFDRSVDIRIWRLRQRIEPDPGKPEVIKTVRGGGYVFVPGRPGGPGA